MLPTLVLSQIAVSKPAKAVATVDGNSKMMELVLLPHSGSGASGSKVDAACLIWILGPCLPWASCSLFSLETLQPIHLELAGIVLAGFVCLIWLLST